MGCQNVPETCKNERLITVFRILRKLTADAKFQVQDKCFYVENRRTALIKHCAEGDECGFWNFLTQSDSPNLMP